MQQLISNIIRHLHSICLCPSRHVGSHGNEAAQEYIESEFCRLGYSNVAREPFPTTGWHFGSMMFVDLDNACTPVPGALPCFFSQSAKVSGVPVWLTEQDLKSMTVEQVAGRLYIVEFFSDGSDIRGRNGIAEELDRLGAAAAVFISDSDYHTTCAASTKIQRSPLLKTLGTAVVSEEGAYYLANNRSHRFSLAIDAGTFPCTSNNIVAIRTGQSPCFSMPATGQSPETAHGDARALPRAVFGAHFDGAPMGQAACDNASGVASLLELARLLKDEAPEWTFEFVAFDAEEYCKNGNLPTGSEAYTLAHPDRKWSFFMNFDSVGMHFAKDVLHVGRREILPSFTSRYPLLPIKNGGDDRSFDRLEVPTLWFNSHAKFKDFHTPLDTIATLDIPRIGDFVQDAVQVVRQLCAR
ncbi:MAG: M28 family peptidase [Victivallales bacterium]|nr:M28 family peptidase [Victivallales bacterium]